MSLERSASAAITAISILIGAALAFAGSHSGWMVASIPGFMAAVVIAFAVQWIVFIPAAIARTDRYFDLTASLTYIGVTTAMLALAPELDLRIQGRAEQYRQVHSDGTLVSGSPPQLPRRDLALGRRVDHCCASINRLAVDRPPLPALRHSSAYACERNTDARCKSKTKVGQ